jgi:hypothetical protein
MKSEPSNLIPMVAVCTTSRGHIAVLGVTAEVEQSVEKQQRAFAIEVIAATGAR